MVIGKESRMTQAAIVSSITAAIAYVLGTTATLLTPFVALGLMVMLQVGKNAWCADA
jgi:hypothetical protein